MKFKITLLAISLSAWAAAQDLYVGNGGTFHAEPSAVVFVDGAIEVHPGGTAQFEAGPGTDGQVTLIQNQNVSNTGVIEFECRLRNTNADWRQFSFPVTETMNSFLFSGLTLYDQSAASNLQNIFGWDATNSGGGVANGWLPPNFGGNNTEGRGWTVFSANNGAHNFTQTWSVEGEPTNGNQTYALGFTEDPNGTGLAANYTGWNLLSNPYPCGLDIFALINSGNFTPTYKAVHVWDEVNNQYRPLITAGVIVNPYNNPGNTLTADVLEPFQAFWVQTNANQNMTITNTFRTEDFGTKFMKTQNTHDLLQLDVVDANQNWDGLVVYFPTMVSATDKYDAHYDAYKLKSSDDDVPTTFLHQQGRNWQVQALNPQSWSIPTHFESKKDNEQYTYKLDVANLDPSWVVELEDLKLNKRVDLRAGDYTFVHHTSNAVNRFILHLNPSSSVGQGEDNNFGNNAVAWGYDGNLLVQLDNVASAEVRVFDLSGKLLVEATAEEGRTEIPLSFAHGVYVAEMVTSEGETVREKFTHF